VALEDSMHIEDLRNKARRLESNIVSVGIGKKYVKGQDTGRLALQIGVLKKLPKAYLKASDIVPRSVDSIETDVVEVGDVRIPELIKSQEVDRTVRVRPAPCGVSIGHKDVTAGTLGLVATKNGKRVIVTNNHVGANVNRGVKGDPWYQPGPYDGGQFPDIIARLSEYVPIYPVNEIPSDCPVGSTLAKVFNFLAEKFNRATRLSATVIHAEPNLVDVSLGEVLHPYDVTFEVLGFGSYNLKDIRVVEPEIDMTVKKSGRTTGCTEGKVTAIDVTLNVNMGSFIAVFEDQFLTTPMSEGGDSGSHTFTKNMDLVGLLFAGSEQITAHNTYMNVINEIDLDAYLLNDEVFLSCT